MRVVVAVVGVAAAEGDEEEAVRHVAEEVGLVSRGGSGGGVRTGEREGERERESFLER